MRLPQELFAEALWMEWQWTAWIFRPRRERIARIRELLRRYNLRPRKDVTDSDLDLLLGRALKNAYAKSPEAQIEKIAEKTDQTCTIARWDLAVARYGRFTATSKIS